MSNGEIDRLQVNQLTERYGGLARSAVYKRLKDLGIKAESIGNKAYVNAEQLALLDELHEFLQSGKNRSAAEFIDMKGLKKPDDFEDEPSPGLSFGQPSDIVQLVTAIAAQLTNKLQPAAPARDPMAYFEVLERAAQNGWELKTSEVAYLLDVSIEEIEQCADRFNDAGFIFTQAGYRQNRRSWKVSKPLK
jgi:hypothetical protein